jgi:hypothetical protein
MERLGDGVQGILAGVLDTKNRMNANSQPAQFNAGNRRLCDPRTGGRFARSKWNYWRIAPGLSMEEVPRSAVNWSSAGVVAKGRKSAASQPHAQSGSLVASGLHGSIHSNEAEPFPDGTRVFLGLLGTTELAGPLREGKLKLCGWQPIL